MHPIVPIIMALGAIPFLVGTFYLAKLGLKQIKIIKIRGKEYTLTRFVLTTTLSGIALIMLSVYIHILFPPEPEPEIAPTQAAVSSNLKYELETLFSDVDDEGPLMIAINRFQSEYQAALQEGDRNTIELLILEMAFRLRTELKNQDFPTHQIENEVTRIMKILRENSI
ncbi:MAG: hypothetical protein K0U40_10190 [Betaproteobacteria bacterium]|nr:hypothetical protein [Betaproteobacteria bacterium]